MSHIESIGAEEGIDAGIVALAPSLLPPDSRTCRWKLLESLELPNRLQVCAIVSTF